MTARKSIGKKRARQQSGSAKRKRYPPGAKAKHHNAPNGKRHNVCGEVMRVGGMLVEIVKDA